MAARESASGPRSTRYPVTESSEGSSQSSVTCPSGVTAVPIRDGAAGAPDFFLCVRRAGYHPGSDLRPRPAPVSVVLVVGRVAGADADLVLGVAVQAFEGMRGCGRVGVAVLLGVRRVVVIAPGPVHPVIGGRVMRRLGRLPGDDQPAGVVVGGGRAAYGAVLGLLGRLVAVGSGAGSAVGSGVGSAATVRLASCQGPLHGEFACSPWL